MGKLTINEFLLSAAPEIWDDNYETAPIWPGDVFAVAAAILHRSGAYSGIGSTITLDPVDPVEWENQCCRLAVAWRIAVSRKAPKVPAAVQKLWGVLANPASCEVFVDDVQVDKPLANALVSLCAIADEAFAGVGVISFSELIGRSGEQAFWDKCYQRLSLNKKKPVNPNDSTSVYSTLTDKVDASRLQVLPKAQTPSSGLSIRSLTHYVSLCPQQHLDLAWQWHHTSNPFVGDHHCNVLLFPWPFEVSPTQFADAHCDSGRPRCVGAETAWFEYAPDSSWDVVSTLEAFIAKANRKVGKVHAVIMPETAVNALKFNELAKVCEKQDIFLIGGVADTECSGAADGATFGRNTAEIMVPNYLGPGMPHRSSQTKHHRWKLDRNQIRRYSLSGVLDPEKTWWEHIPIRSRSLRVSQCVTG